MVTIAQKSGVLQKWTWELKDLEDNSYLAKFPSKGELPTGARLKFELWQEKGWDFYC
jgi:hypothetical protein